MNATGNCMEQGSEEWLNMRKSFIGASDCPAIMGVSPYTTPYELWLDKLGLLENTEMTPAMQRGKDLEPEALKLFNKDYTEPFEPCIRFHETISYMMASLDGFRLCNGNPEILEIKCNGKKVRESLSENGIPDHHYAQLQHQIEVCKAKEAIYMSFDGEIGTHFVVKRDEEFIQKMLKKQAEFWDCVSGLTPPKMTEKDRNRINKNKSTPIYDARWDSLVIDYEYSKSQVAYHQEELEKIKKLLIDIAEEKSVHGNGFRLSKVEKKGFIDYDVIPELKGVDLEKYRKPSSTYWKIENE